MTNETERAYGNRFTVAPMPPDGYIALADLAAQEYAARGGKDVTTVRKTIHQAISNSKRAALPAIDEVKVLRGSTLPTIETMKDAAGRVLVNVATWEAYKKAREMKAAKGKHK